MMAAASLQPVLNAQYAATSPESGILTFVPHAILRIGSTAAGFTAEYTADATVNLHTLTGFHGETTFDDIHFVIIEVIKTATTSSGTVVITGAGVLNKLAATTIDAGTADALAALSGASIYTYVIGHSTALDVSSGTNTIDLNFTTPVGFKVRLTVVAA